MTCDVTPHHLAFHDGWVGGDRRYAWEAVARPWAGGRPTPARTTATTRVNPPLRVPDRRAGPLGGPHGWHGRGHRHRSRPASRGGQGSRVRPGRNGISGLETALRGAPRGHRRGPGRPAHGRPRVDGRARSGSRARPRPAPEPGLTVGAAADLVVVDRAATWTVEPRRSVASPRTRRCWGGPPGRVLPTVARGRFAYLDTDGRAARPGRAGSRTPSSASRRRR